MSEASTRQNTRLESEGAEFLVLGHLLLEGVSCFKAYVNFPGYDLIATHPTSGRTARIQVKSRWATDYDRTFPIKNFDCEFVVHVALNRGYRFKKAATVAGDGLRSPDFYVFPVAAVKAARKLNDAWGKINITSITGYEQYKDAWPLIKAHLAPPAEA